MRAFLYKPDGTISTPRPVLGEQFTVKELQDLMGGNLFEVVDLDDSHGDKCKQLGLPSGTILVCNDDKRGQQLNGKITIRLGMQFFGDILMCDGRLVPRNAEAIQLRGVMSEKMERQLRMLKDASITCFKCSDVFKPTLTDIYKVDGKK
jgi:hypothetical protein